jgi:MYXO-CTERM domain-containing protein
MTNTVSLALASRDDEDLRSELAPLLERLASHATNDTHQFGEVTVTTRDGGVARADQRVSTPHLWEGTLFYLTAMALEDPDALLRYEDALPRSRVIDEGCGCTVRPRTGDKSGALSPLVLVLLAILIRRNRSVPYGSRSVPGRA